MSARAWHRRRYTRRFRNFAVCIVDRETAETPDDLLRAERRVRRTVHLLNRVRPRQRSRD